MAMYVCMYIYIYVCVCRCVCVKVCLLVPREENSLFVNQCSGFVLVVPHNKLLPLLCDVPPAGQARASVPSQSKPTVWGHAVCGPLSYSASRVWVIASSVGGKCGFCYIGQANSSCCLRFSKYYFQLNKINFIIIPEFEKCIIFGTYKNSECWSHYIDSLVWSQACALSADNVYGAE